MEGGGGEISESLEGAKSRGGAGSLIEISGGKVSTQAAYKRQTVLLTKAECKNAFIQSMKRSTTVEGNQTQRALAVSKNPNLTKM